MQKMEILPEETGNILCQNINNENVIFVFPTDTVMNSWIDWLILNPEKSGVEAVPFERFCAWDNFKGKYVQAQKQGYNVIPSILRKLFVTNLIASNAQKPQKERLQVIINPDDEYAKNAASFEEWIEKNLSSLNFWKKRLEKNAEEYLELDAEDKDYFFIYNEYNNFLEQNKLFEPAWVNPETFENRHTFLIFFPELLEDFCDFEEIFSSSNNIKICTLSSAVPSPKVYKYADSRTELRQTMLRIINLVQSGKADWSEIALSIPDIDTYRPYIDREFSLYSIPYVIKSGQSLTTNCAGRIFREIYDCHTSDFTYDSVRALLLDECVPWKTEIERTKESLIREGNRMRCICSPGQKDIWKQCFASKIKRLELSGNPATESDYFENLKNFYNRLKSAVESFFAPENNSFNSILASWLKFKAQFLQDNSDFTEEANNIISRCIKELESIIMIEKQYQHCELKVPSPFDFFLKIIDNKTYTPQTKATGVNIFKYKLTAAANFKYQFVIDASQRNIEVQNRRLTFLNATKRAKLHLIEDDRSNNATQTFIKLYAKNTEVADSSFVHFSYAEDSFSGFAIAHSMLEELKNNEVPDFNEEDYILSERNYILGRTSSITAITENQKNQYKLWQKTNLNKTKEPYSLNPSLEKRLSQKIDKQSGLIRISARGDLEKFFPCPRRWVLKSLLNLEEDSLDTSLMQKYDMGNLNHKILELVLGNFENHKLPYFDTEKNEFYIIPENSKQGINQNPVLYTKDLNNLILKKTEEALKAPSDFRDSILALSTLEAQKNQLAQKISVFLQTLLKPHENGGFGNCTVIAEEKKLSLEKNGLMYYGIIDCLLKNPDGEWIIIDYKNKISSIPDKKDIMLDDDKLLHDFQMPMYYTLLNVNDDDLQGGYFYSISDSKNRVVTDKSGKNPMQAFIPTRIALDEYAELFKVSVENKKFVPKSSSKRTDRQNVKSYIFCIKCPFKTICRTTYTVAGNEIDLKIEE